MKMNITRFLFPVMILLIFMLHLNLYSQVTKWVSYGPGGGGALYCPVISPHNPLEIFVPTDMSDLFHSNDFGASYSTVHFNYITAGSLTNVQFTNARNILYTINQHEFGNFPVKSTDGGNTWTKLTSDPTSGGAYQLFASDLDFNKVIVTDYSNIYYSINGGNSFSTIFEGNSGTWGSYIAGVFWDTDNIYICMPDGFLVYIKNQGFQEVKPAGIGSSEYIISVASAKNNNTIRFYVVTNGSCWPGMTGAERSDYKSVYVIDYGSASWVKKINGLTANDKPFFASMAKDDIDVAYISGQDGSQFGPSVYKTTDGGNNWKNVFNLQNNQNIRTGWSGSGGDRDWSFGEYTLGFSVCLTNPDYLIVTDLGFAHVSSDGGDSWSQAYVRKSDENPANSPTPKGKSYHSIGLEQTTCWFLTWSDNGNIFAGYTDIRGCRSTDAGDSWSFDYTGHSDNTMYMSLKHPDSGYLYAATSTVHDMYASTYLTDNRIDGGRGKILYSTNRGKDWLTLHDFAHPVVWLSLDPNNPDRMYASVIHSTQGGIFVSNDIDKGIASTWTKLSNPPRTEGHPYIILAMNDGSLLCSYSGRISNDRRTFYPSSGVFFSTNGGNTWFDRSDANMQYWTKDVVIDPNDPTQNTWFACVYSGWGGAANNKGGLYKTTNRGVNWTKILNLARVESCTVNPANTNEMYVTTEYEGLHYTNNLNSQSPSFSLVESYFFKHPLRVFYNPYKTNEIWITSFGNGISKSGTEEKKVTSISITPSTELFIGDSLQLTVNILPADAENKNISFISSNPAIASVSQIGMVKALSEGNTEIIAEAEDGGFKDTCHVTVSKKIISVTGITLNTHKVNLIVGDTEQLTFTIFPENATNKNVTWRSERPDLATVNNSGLVTGLRSNDSNTYVYVTTNDGGFSDTCEVDVLLDIRVNDTYLNSEITIFPNPASEYIEINVGTRLAMSLQDDIKIYNILGECVSNPTLPNREGRTVFLLSPLGEGQGVRFDVSDLPNGIYTIVIQNGNEIITEKFVVLR